MSMPARQPFTALCQTAGRRSALTRVDLHVHTTASDGDYAPTEVVELARRCGMPALAITDHDTVAGVAPAREAAAEALEVIAGVEITAHHRDQTIHVLGYFFDPDHPALVEALATLRTLRAERFHEMMERLRSLGIELRPSPGASASPVALASPVASAPGVLGRRHLAAMMIEAGHVGSVGEAFARYLKDGSRAVVPFRGLPADDAISVIRAAGGVTSWAHPPETAMLEQVRDLRQLGLQALEVEFPACRPKRRRELRQYASHSKMAITGGSDCHGPDDPRRQLGCAGVTLAELEALRKNRTGPAVAILPR